MIILTTESVVSSVTEAPSRLFLYERGEFQLCQLYEGILVTAHSAVMGGTSLKNNGLNAWCESSMVLCKMMCLEFDNPCNDSTYRLD